MIILAIHSIILLASTSSTSMHTRSTSVSIHSCGSMVFIMRIFLPRSPLSLLPRRKNTQIDFRNCRLLTSSAIWSVGTYGLVTIGSDIHSNTRNSLPDCSVLHCSSSTADTNRISQCFFHLEPCGPRTRSILVAWFLRRPGCLILWPLVQTGAVLSLSD